MIPRRHHARAKRGEGVGLHAGLACRREAHSHMMPASTNGRIASARNPCDSAANFEVESQWERDDVDVGEVRADPEGRGAERGAPLGRSGRASRRRACG